MHKRILCLLLTALMLLSLIPALALPAEAASNMKTSEACIAILKDMEGFIKYPVFDNGQYSVGYGSGCGKNDYPNGITEEEADTLLREYLASMEKSLNDFANRNNFLFSQNQFDALMLFTYNCGGNWINGDGEFRQAVLNNDSGNNFIFHITQWTAASAQLHLGLVNRRLIEADMYLNGSYTNEKPANYTYVIYDNNGGEGKVKVQGYDSNLSAYVQAVPTREGYKFLGWYSKAEGGSWITALSAQNAAQTLYAHWQAAGATHENAASANYQISSASMASRNCYKTPNGTKIGTISVGTMVTIRVDYVDGNGVKWGKLANGYWVKLGDPRIGGGDESETESGVKVTVTGDYVNVRTGPGTEYKVVSGVLEGSELVITACVDVKGVLWGQFRGGWICLDYTDYSGGLTPGQKPENIPGNDPVTESFVATGTITATTLNIRAAAGTNGYIMGTYKKGDKVTITAKSIVNGVPWGKTDRGWISLAYVKLDSASQTPETTVPETTAPNATAPETTAPSGSQTPNSGTSQGIPATVISKTGLNIRAGAGTNFASVGNYASGDKIAILEQKTVGGVAWGKTNKGWVCMQYVRLDESWTSAAGVYGVVISGTGLNVRSGAGVGYAIVANYASGQRIVILEQKVVSGKKWGRTDKGWVCMDYVRLEQAVPGSGNSQQTPSVPETTVPGTTAPETSKPENDSSAMTGIVTAGGLNVRASAGTNSAIVGGYQKGDKVTILEKKVVNGTTWGRTDKGWIHLGYVKLDNTQSGNNTDANVKPGVSAGSTGVVTAGSLCIRKGPGTANAILGTYSRGNVVKILEIAKVGTTTWGRTDKGWICMDYVKITANPGGNTGNETEATTAPEKETTAATTAPEKETTAATTAPEEETTVATTAPEEETTEATTAPEEETTEATTVPDVPTFDFTYEAFVTAMNAEMASDDAVAKSVNSSIADTVAYEFVAISDSGSYGVVMYIDLAKDGKKAAGITMICDAASEDACNNLIAFALYSMQIVDNTITEADIEKMVSEPYVDSAGHQYYIMERESGEYAFVLAGDLFHFYVYPLGE